MALTKVINKSDWVGVFASGLCLVHCLATPFLFVAHANIGLHVENHPSWWGFLDIVFLLLSFFAVYWSAKNTSKKWVRYAFWCLWGMLALIVVNEKWALWHLAEEAIYLPSMGLVLLHLYNHRYCHCKDGDCCADLQ
ncbi:MerC domain-containing protein [Allomuricauda sp. SCSIO 65647]|uniref:MerC domain-containing protein n=1 Tax=Allomuricauda sp. SCSIO 65647 TaxID=2908843 RepID=UPI001F297A05|nr:MerC domain-containing protein [Muricauda sp. SCSIO 65647]UJH67190.1 MerC domain-containing protein [Muricauda sp. SCSIO 65647]